MSEEEPVVALLACVEFCLELDFGYFDVEAKVSLRSDEGPNVKDGVANLEIFHLIVPLDSFDFIVIKVAAASELDLVGDLHVFLFYQSTIKVSVRNTTDCSGEGESVTLDKLLLSGKHINWVFNRVERFDSVPEWLLKKVP